MRHRLRLPRRARSRGRAVGTRPHARGAAHGGVPALLAGGGRLGLAAVCALLVAADPAHAAPAARYLAGGDTCPGAHRGDGPVSAQERTMRCLLNAARALRGLAPLRTDARLVRSAQGKARAIARCGEFSHTPCGRPFVRSFHRAGYVGARPWRVGENLAWMAPRRSATPRAIVAAWLRSPAHRANLFAPWWREQGVHLRRLPVLGAHRDVALWVSQFGTGG